MHISGMSATRSEISATTTVLPANTMALPDVATERAIDSTTGTPEARLSWCRLIRNNA